MKEYLSHGVYAEYDPKTKMTTLTTDDEYNKNVIYLYSLVYRNLMEFIKRMEDEDERVSRR